MLIILAMLGALSGGVIHQRVVVTAYLPGLVPGFALIGMTIRSDTDDLAVIDLKAAHTGDTLRLSGSLQNNSDFNIPQICWSPLQQLMARSSPNKQSRRMTRLLKPADQHRFLCS